ncbi:hypothetical protein D9M72_509290 [compost metagenome]
MREGDGQAPGATVGVVVFARQLVELLVGEEGDLVVIFHLVGDLGDAGAGDRAEIVVPPVDALAGLAIVWRPAEIGRVDVGRQPFLEAVQLVRADEMHLARQRRVVAGAAQVVCIGRDRGLVLGGVVVDAGAARQLAGHEGGAGRGAERRRGVIVAEPGRAGGECLQVRCMQERGRSVRKELSVQLVDHDDKDVRSCGHAAVPWYVSRSMCEVT